MAELTVDGPQIAGQCATSRRLYYRRQGGSVLAQACATRRRSSSHRLPCPTLRLVIKLMRCYSMTCSTLEWADIAGLGVSASAAACNARARYLIAAQAGVANNSCATIHNRRRINSATNTTIEYY